MIIEETVVDIEESDIKTATIRGESVRECPFGLDVPDACLNAGEAVNRMAPMEEDVITKKANRLVYAYHKTCQNCPYADKILEKHDKVDCNFGDTAAGRKSTSYRGSPLYPQTISGIGQDGLHGHPLGFYADNQESRNLFFGLFSLLGAAKVEELIKLAEKYDAGGEKEKSEILDNLLNKLQSIKEQYKDTFEKIEKHLEEHRIEYEKNRDDPGLLWQISNKWFGFRQVNR